MINLEKKKKKSNNNKKKKKIIMRSKTETNCFLNPIQIITLEINKNSGLNWIGVFVRFVNN